MVANLVNPNKFLQDPNRHSISDVSQTNIYASEANINPAKYFAKEILAISGCSFMVQSP